MECEIDDLQTKETDVVSNALAEFVVALVTHEISDLKLPIFFDGYFL